MWCNHPYNKKKSGGGGQRDIIQNLKKGEQAMYGGDLHKIGGGGG